MELLFRYSLTIFIVLFINLIIIIHTITMSYFSPWAKNLLLTTLVPGGVTGGAEWERPGGTSTSASPTRGLGPSQLLWQGLRGVGTTCAPPWGHCSPFCTLLRLETPLFSLAQAQLFPHTRRRHSRARAAPRGEQHSPPRVKPPTQVTRSHPHTEGVWTALGIKQSLQNPPVPLSQLPPTLSAANATILRASRCFTKPKIVPKCVSQNPKEPANVAGYSELLVPISQLVEPWIGEK